MVQRVEIVLEDDLDGGVADKTVEFAWNGDAYEIDLSNKHAGEFEKAMTRWVESARRLSAAARSQVASSGSRSHSRKGTRTDPAQLAAVRAWAKEQKLPVSDRGRIAASVAEAYQKAHSTP